MKSPRLSIFVLGLLILLPVLFFQNCAGTSAGGDSLASAASNSLAPVNPNSGGGDPYTGIIIKTPIDVPLLIGGDGNDYFTEETCPLDGDYAYKLRVISQHRYQIRSTTIGLD